MVYFIKTTINCIHYTRWARIILYRYLHYLLKANENIRIFLEYVTYITISTPIVSTYIYYNNVQTMGETPWIRIRVLLATPLSELLFSAYRLASYKDACLVFLDVLVGFFDILWRRNRWAMIRFLLTNRNLNLPRIGKTYHVSHIFLTLFLTGYGRWLNHRISMVYIM